MLELVIVVFSCHSSKCGNSNDNGFITLTASYTTSGDTTLRNPPKPKRRPVATKDAARHRPDLTPPDESEPLSSLRLRAGLTDEHAAKLCGVTAQTWRRWLDGKVAVPTSVRRLLQLYAGNVPSADRAWCGFLFRGDRLYAPNGESITPGEIEHIQMFKQQEAHLHARLEELEFWRSRSGREEQVRMARAFGALDLAVYALVELNGIIEQAPSERVKRELGSMMAAVNALLSCEERMSAAVGVENSR